MLFHTANHAQRRIVSAPSPVGFFFTLGVSLAVPGLLMYYAIIFNRNRSKLSRRVTQAAEMMVLKARSDRFRARLDGGEVMGEEEVQEGERMESLFRRWVRSLEDNAAADDEGSSAAAKAERWPGWF